MDSIIDHQPWCSQHQFNPDGSSWFCSNIYYRSEASGPLVELTHTADEGTRLELYCHSDVGLSAGPSARDRVATGRGTARRPAGRRRL